MLEIPTLTYEQAVRDEFKPKDSKLRQRWADKYKGILFDDKNIQNAFNQITRYFYDWYTAIQFYEAFGYHALIHRQARDKLRRCKTHEVLGRYPGLMEYLTQPKRPAEKTVMFPDVFVYNPKCNDDWLMIECKGPKDRLRPHQKVQNSRIEELSGRPVLLLYLKPSVNVVEELQVWIEKMGEVRASILGHAAK